MFKTFNNNKMEVIEDGIVIFTSENWSDNDTFLNQTNSTDLPDTQIVSFVIVLSYVDLVVRVTACLIFVAYFLMVALLKDLRKSNLLYVHHGNLVGFFFIIMYMFYFNTTQPSFSSAYLNDLYCKLSEISWSMLRYLRTYSILLIAVQRLIAVHFVRIFKKMSHSYVYMIIPIVFVWVFSIICVFSTKFGFQTTYGSLFCIDGYSNEIQSALGYLITSSITGIALPFLLTFILYIII